MKSLLILLLLLLLFSAIVAAQTVNTGKITDASNNEPLVGANIYVRSDWQKGAVSDVNGVFILQGLISGDTLVVSFIGYEEKQMPYQGQPVMEIKLQPSISSISEVVIEAERMVAEEFTYKKVNRLDIYLNPSAKADPLLAVNTLPSSTTTDESANISFRGSGPGETGVFFNNVPIYDFVRFSQLNGIGTFGIFNTAILNELLVFPGNPPLEYGNTVSGLVALKTSDKITDERVRTATVSLASYGLLLSQKLNRNQKITIFGNYQPSTLIKSINTKALNDIKDFNSIDLGISYLNHLDESTILKIFNYSLIEGYDFNYNLPTLNTTFKQRKKRNFTISNLRRKVGNSEITLNSKIGFSRSQFSYADTDINTDNFDGFSSLNYQLFLSKFNLKTGISIDYRQQFFDGTFYIFDYAQGLGFPTNSITSTNTLNRPEGYLYLTYFIYNNLTLGGGLRANIPQHNQESFLSSQMSTKYSFDSKNSIVLGLGNYHRYDFATDGDFTLKEGRQISFDYQFTTEELKFTFSAYAKKTMIETVENEIKGIEIFIDAQIAKKLTGQISYSLVDGISKHSSGIKYPNANDLDYFIRGNLQFKPNALWTLSSTFSFRQGTYYQPVTSAVFDSELYAYTPQYSDLNEQIRLPDYGIMDMSITRLIPISERLNMIAFGSVNNILNKKNIRHYSYNADYTKRTSSLYSQRTLYFGVILNF